MGPYLVATPYPRCLRAPAPPHVDMHRVHLCSHWRESGHAWNCFCPLYVFTKGQLYACWSSTAGFPASHVWIQRPPARISPSTASRLIAGGETVLSARRPGLPGLPAFEQPPSSSSWVRSWRPLSGRQHLGRRPIAGACCSSAARRGNSARGASQASGGISLSRSQHCDGSADATPVMGSRCTARAPAAPPRRPYAGH